MECQEFKSSNRSIKADLDPLNLPDHVKAKAQTIFLRFPPRTKRGKRRKQLIFVCVYYAFKELKIHDKELACEPRQLAATIGLGVRDMTKALSMFGGSQTGYRPPCIFLQPKDLLPVYAQDLCLPLDLQDDLFEFATSILLKAPHLEEIFPQKVAAGILKYFLEIRGVSLIIQGEKIGAKEFAEKVKLSEVTIQSIYKEITCIDNA